MIGLRPRLKGELMDKKQNICLARKIIGYALLFVCAVLILYFLSVMLYRLFTVSAVKRFSAFSRFMAEFGITCLLSAFALDVRFGIFAWKKNKAVKAIGVALRFFCCAFCVLFVTLASAIMITGGIKDDNPVDSVCVLGLSIDGDELPRDLIHRLDTALDYRLEHSDKIFVVTGGNSEDPYYSEASYMYRYLVENGFVGEEMLIAETEAKSTVENFEKCAEIIDKEKSVALITNNYHIFRASKIAKKQGYTSIVKVPAPAEPLLYAENICWESICSIFETLGGDMAY